MPSAVPILRREHKNDAMDVMCCLTRVSGFSAKNMKSSEYPNPPSANETRATWRQPSNIPKQPDNWTLEEADEDTSVLGINWQWQCSGFWTVFNRFSTSHNAIWIKWSDQRSVTVAVRNRSEIVGFETARIVFAVTRYETSSVSKVPKWYIQILWTNWVLGLLSVSTQKYCFCFE